MSPILAIALLATASAALHAPFTPPRHATAPRRSVVRLEEKGRSSAKRTPAAPSGGGFFGNLKRGLSAELMKQGLELSLIHI